MMSTTRFVLDQSIIPLQPELSSQLQYREHLLKWNPYSQKNLALCYQFQTGSDGTPIRLIPDACVDFLFKCNPDSPSAVVSGLQTVPRELFLEPNTVYFGFKPYSLKGMRHLSSSWSELVDHSASLGEGVPGAGRVAELLASKHSFDERADVVTEFAQTRLADSTYTPDFIEYSELRLCGACGNLKLDSISDYTGYTGRYCREKFKESHGISVKSYSNMMRFQNAVRLLIQANSAESLADVAYQTGYFDQSHMTREFRRFSGNTPLHFRQESHQQICS